MNFLRLETVVHGRSQFHTPAFVRKFRFYIAEKVMRYSFSMIFIVCVWQLLKDFTRAYLIVSDKRAISVGVVINFSESCVQSSDIHSETLTAKLIRWIPDTAYIGDEKKSFHCL